MSQQDQAPKNTDNLSEEDLQSTTGGSLLGGDDSILKVVTQGYVNTSHTDEDGDTESNSLDFGSGTLLDSEND